MASDWHRQQQQDLDNQNAYFNQEFQPASFSLESTSLREQLSAYDSDYSNNSPIQPSGYASGQSSSPVGESQLQYPRSSPSLPSGFTLDDTTTTTTSRLLGRVRSTPTFGRVPSDASLRRSNHSPPTEHPPPLHPATLPGGSYYHHHPSGTQSAGNTTPAHPYYTLGRDTTRTQAGRENRSGQSSPLQNTFNLAQSSLPQLDSNSFSWQAAGLDQGIRRRLAGDIDINRRHVGGSHPGWTEKAFRDQILHHGAGQRSVSQVFPSGQPSPQSESLQTHDISQFLQQRPIPNPADREYPNHAPNASRHATSPNAVSRGSAFQSGSAALPDTHASSQNSSAQQGSVGTAQSAADDGGKKAAKITSNETHFSEWCTGRMRWSEIETIPEPFQNTLADLLLNIDSLPLLGEPPAAILTQLPPGAPKALSDLTHAVPEVKKYVEDLTKAANPNPHELLRKLIATASPAPRPMLEKFLAAYPSDQWMATDDASFNAPLLAFHLWQLTQTMAHSGPELSVRRGIDNLIDLALGWPTPRISAWSETLLRLPPDFRSNGPMKSRSFRPDGIGGVVHPTEIEGADRFVTHKKQGPGRVTVIYFTWEHKIRDLEIAKRQMCLTLVAAHNQRKYLGLEDILIHGFVFIEGSLRIYASWLNRRINKVVVSDALRTIPVNFPEGFLTFYRIMCNLRRYIEDIARKDNSALKAAPLALAPGSDGNPPTARGGGTGGHPPAPERDPRNREGHQTGHANPQTQNTSSSPGGVSGYMHSIALDLIQLPNRALVTLHNTILERARAALCEYAPDSPVVPVRLRGIKTEIELLWIDHWHRCGIPPSDIDLTLDCLFEQALEASWIAATHDVRELCCYLMDPESGIDATNLAPIVCVQPIKSLAHLMEAPSNIFRRLQRIWVSGGEGDPVLDSLDFDSDYDDQPLADDVYSEEDTFEEADFAEDIEPGYGEEDDYAENGADGGQDRDDEDVGSHQEILEDRVEPWLCHVPVLPPRAPSAPAPHLLSTQPLGPQDSAERMGLAVPVASFAHLDVHQVRSQEPSEAPSTVGPITPSPNTFTGPIGNMKRRRSSDGIATGVPLATGEHPLLSRQKRAVPETLHPSFSPTSALPLHIRSQVEHPAAKRVRTLADVHIDSTSPTLRR